MGIKNLYFTVQTLRHQWLNTQQLERLQNKRFLALFRYAYCYNKFYNKLYRQNKIRLNNIKSVKDINKLPPITRNDIQKNLHSIVNSSLYGSLQSLKKKDVSYPYKTDDYTFKATSGSTGLPLVIPFNRVEEHKVLLLYLRSLLARSYKPGQMEVRLGPSPHKGFVTGLKVLGFNILPRYYIQSHMPLHEQINLLKTFHTFVLQSHPSVLYSLAQYMKKHATSISPPSFITSRSEILNEKVRQCVQDILKANVYNEYSLKEIGPVAWECREHGFHINADSFITEFCNPGFRSKEKEMLITNLLNYSFPLIRYQTGDTAIESDGSCACGRSLPLIKNLHGRKNDFILLKEGTLLSSGSIDALLSRLKGISQYKFIQKNVDDFELLLVKTDGLNEDSLNHLYHEIKDILNSDNPKICIKFVKRISNAGKLCTVESRIPFKLE